MNDQGDVYDVGGDDSTLARLLDRVQAGEEITIARRGRRIARLAPLPRPRVERRPGALKGTIWWAQGADRSDLDDDLIDLMENGPIGPDEQS